MRICYLHGFASSFDENAEKCLILKGAGYEIVGYTIDYTRHSVSVLHEACNFCISEKVDALIGTSMGGWLASQVGNILGLPFVSINPAITPNITLKKFEGEGKDFIGKKFLLDEKVIQSYQNFNLDGFGLILLDKGDELLPYKDTLNYLNNMKEVHVFDGGNHRFAHMRESLQLIQQFFNKSECSYGI